MAEEGFFSTMPPPSKAALEPIANDNGQGKAAFFSDVGMRMGNAVAQKAGDIANRREQGIDYYSGVPMFGIRAGLSRMDTDTEKHNYLEDQFGTGNVRKDKFGAWIIEPAGLLRHGIKASKPVALDEQRGTIYDLADMAGSVPALVGGTGYAMAASGMGAIPGMAMAGLGAAGGKALDEVVKFLQGYNKKSGEEEARFLGKEAATMAAAEGVGRALVGAGRFVRGPYRNLSNPERNALTNEALDSGLTPKLYQSSPHAPIAKRFQMMGVTALGDPVDKKNAARIAEMGSEIVNRIGGQSSKIEAGELVTRDILAARRSFSISSDALYAEVDKLATTPTIPTASLKSEAAKILDELPRTVGGDPTFASAETIKFLRGIEELPDMLGARQMQLVRSELRNSAEVTNLVPGIMKHQSRRLFRAADQTFDDAVKVNASNKPLVDALRKADAQYAEGIKAFDDHLLSSLTRDAGRSGAVDPEKVVDFVIRPNSASRVTRVKGMVTDQTWREVQYAHMQDMLSDMRQIRGDPLDVKVMGETLSKQLDKLGRPTVDAIYGPGLTGDLFRFAKLSQFVTNEQAKPTVAIVAASVALRPLSHLGKLGEMFAMKHLMVKPGFIHWINEGLSSTSTTEAVAAFTKAASYATAELHQETGAPPVGLPLTRPEQP